MSEHPPDWCPDPDCRHEHRSWDGHRRTDQVADHGRQRTDPMTTSAPLPTTGMSQAKIQGQAAKAGATSGPAGGGLLDQPVLVVDQKVELIELNNE